jgi:hypothetical protein
MKRQGASVAEIRTARSAPRRDDVEARQLIERNRATITKLADQLSMGAFSAARQPRQEPQAEGLIIHALGGAPAAEEPLPYVRISPNDRVVLADEATGRQLEFLGQVRRQNGARRFVLATKANGFFAEMSVESASRLAALDGKEFLAGYGDDELIADIRVRLQLA